jgi:hypothetical protein
MSTDSERFQWPAIVNPDLLITFWEIDDPTSVIPGQFRTGEDF